MSRFECPRAAAAAAATALLVGTLSVCAPVSARSAAPESPALIPTSTAAGSWCSATTPAPLRATTATVLKAAVRRYAATLDRPVSAGFPYAAFARETDWERGSIRRWTSGFTAATAWWLWRSTGDQIWLRRARTWTNPLLGLARWKDPRAHDLGFMIGLPVRLAARFDPSASSRTVYRRALLTAARTLSDHVVPRLRAIAAGPAGGAFGDADEGTWVLIVDDMVNGLLLLDGADVAGPAEAMRLRALGVRHLQALSAALLRPDGSTYHRVAFDPGTGARIGPVPGQGLDAARSTWSRGQAWALAGLAEGARRSGDPTLLRQARRVAVRWQEAVPNGCVPAWDLAVADPTTLRDTSALAIASTGLLDLAAADPDPRLAQRWQRAAAAGLSGLARLDWITPTAPGLLDRQTYNVPRDPREGRYPWGDYYLVAAASGAAALGPAFARQRLG